MQKYEVIMWKFFLLSWEWPAFQEQTKQRQNPARGFLNTPVNPTDSLHAKSSFWPYVSDLTCVYACVCGAFFFFLSSQHILIVQRQLSVLEEELEEFRLALRQYMDCACAQTGCLQSVYILFDHIAHLYQGPFFHCKWFDDNSCETKYVDVTEKKWNSL